MFVVSSALCSPFLLVNLRTVKTAMLTLVICLLYWLFTRVLVGAPPKQERAVLVGVCVDAVRVRDAVLWLLWGHHGPQTSGSSTMGTQLSSPTVPCAPVSIAWAYLLVSCVRSVLAFSSPRVLLSTHMHAPVDMWFCVVNLFCFGG